MISLPSNKRCFGPSSFSSWERRNVVLLEVAKEEASWVTEGKEMSLVIYHIFKPEPHAFYSSPGLVSNSAESQISHTVDNHDHITGIREGGFAYVEVAKRFHVIVISFIRKVVLLFGEGGLVGELELDSRPRISEVNLQLLVDGHEPSVVERAAAASLAAQFCEMDGADPLLGHTEEMAIVVSIHILWWYC